MLGPLPYGCRVTGRASDANRVVVLAVEVLDAAGGVRGTAKLPLDRDEALTTQLVQIVERQMLADSNAVAAVAALCAGIKVGG